eukprot:gene11203-7777_t
MVVLLYSCLFLYTRDSTSAVLQQAFHQEMLMRVSYVSALVDWVPLERLLSSTAVGNIPSSAPFVVTVAARRRGGGLGAAASGIETKPPAMDLETELTSVEMNSEVPPTVYLYNHHMDAVIGVKEQETTRRLYGCTEEFMAVAACFICLAPMAIWSGMRTANLLARSGWVVTAKLAAFVGYVVAPAALAVGLLHVFTVVQARASAYAWEEDVQRSALLYAATFRAVHSLNPTAAAQALQNTLAGVNEKVMAGMERVYQVSLALGPARTVLPPLRSMEVAEAILETNALGATDFRGMTSSRILFASEPVTSIASLVIVARDAGPAPHLVDTQYRVCTIFAVGIILIAGSVLFFVLLPLDALGVVGAVPLFESPWSARLPSLWPHLKLLEALALLAMVLLVAGAALGRVSGGYARVSALHQYYQERSALVRDLQRLSNLLAASHASVLGDGDLTTAYWTYSSIPIPPAQRLDVAMFYKQVHHDIAAQKYDLFSVCERMVANAATGPSDWPLLSNLPAIQEAMLYAQTHLKGMSVSIFQHWILRFDQAVLLALLSNQPSMLTDAQGMLVEQTVHAFQSLSSTTFPIHSSSVQLFTVSTLVSATKENLYTVQPYLDQVVAYRDQTVKTQTIVNLYGSAQGAKVSSVEERTALSMFARVPPAMYMNLSYAWDSFPSFYVCYAVLLAAVLYQSFGVLGSIAFFSGVGCRWVWATCVRDGSRHSSDLDARQALSTTDWLPHARQCRRQRMPVRPAASCGAVETPRPPLPAAPAALAPAPASRRRPAVTFTEAPAPFAAAAAPRRSLLARSNPVLCGAAASPPPPPPSAAAQAAFRALEELQADQRALEMILPTWDGTAPRSFRRADVHLLRRSLRRFVLCSAALLLVSAGAGVAMQQEAGWELHRLAARTAAHQADLVPLAQRSSECALIEMSLAAWTRAYLSLQPAHINRAVMMVASWGKMVATTYTGYEVSQEKAAFTGPALRQAEKVVRRLSIQTALLRTEPEMRSINADYAEMLLLFDDHVHFSKYDTCVSFVIVRYETDVKALMTCLVLGDTDATCSANAIEGITSMSAMCRGRAPVPIDLKAYMERLVALRSRSKMVFDYNDVRRELRPAMTRTQDEMRGILDVVDADVKTLQDVERAALPTRNAFTGPSTAAKSFFFFWFLLFRFLLLHVTPILKAKATRAVPPPLPPHPTMLQPLRRRWKDVALFMLLLLFFLYSTTASAINKLFAKAEAFLCANDCNIHLGPSLLNLLLLFIRSTPFLPFYLIFFLAVARPFIPPLPPVSDAFEGSQSSASLLLLAAENTNTETVIQPNQLFFFFFCLFFPRFPTLNLYYYCLKKIVGATEVSFQLATLSSVSSVSKANQIKLVSRKVELK